MRPPKNVRRVLHVAFIHTFAGMGYAVCADCHEKEFVKEFQKAKDVVSWSEFKGDENNAEEMVESIVNRIDQVLAQLSPTDDYLLGLMDGLKRAKELLETS